jgi:hypothetical protein
LGTLSNKALLGGLLDYHNAITKITMTSYLSGGIILQLISELIFNPLKINTHHKKYCFVEINILAK